MPPQIKVVPNSRTQIAACTSQTLINIDTPQSNQVMAGTVVIGGWALDSQQPISAVSFTIDGVGDSLFGIGVPRTDVCAIWPGCPNVGWNTAFNTAALSDGPHVLAITADGRSSTVTREFNTSNNKPVVYEIVNKLSNKVLDVTGGSPNSGAIIQQYDFAGYSQQK